MKKLSSLGLAAAAVVFTASASASTISYTGLSNGQTSVYSSTVDGITVDVTGTRNGGQANVTTRGAGLGVKGGVDHFQSIGNETMTFTFSSAVDLAGLTFDNGTWRDFWTGKDIVGYSDSAGNTQTFNTNNNHFSLANAGITSFTLSAQGNMTSTFIAGIEFNASPAEVPVPAAAWLFGSALVGLGSFARRKR